MVSKKGLEPLRLKARVPKTLMAAISPLRDKLAYALSMMRLTKQVRSGCSHFSRNLSARPFNRHSVATRLRHQTHNSSFSACPFLGCDRRRITNSKENRSSPLYAICLNWITFLQFVGFDSKLFYGRHCQIEPGGEHPTSIERNRRHLSIRL